LVCGADNSNASSTQHSLILGIRRAFLVSLTRVVPEAGTDNGSSQQKQRDMNAETTLVTNAWFAE
jgi:hypothetical protein